MKVKIVLAVLFVFSMYTTAFAQDGTAEATVETQIVTVVPTEAAAEATAVVTPLAPVCEEGSTCNFNTGDSSGSTDSPSDPSRDVALVASGALVGILTTALTLYIAGARILRGLMGSVWFMAMAEYVVKRGKSLAPEPLRKEAEGATATYGEFIERVTDDVPDILRDQHKDVGVPPLMPPKEPPVPTLPRE